MGFEQQYPLFLSFFLALLPFSTVAQTYRNISLGSSLTAQEDNSLWASPSGDFAFGFRKIGQDGFILAIWFNKIPERTIVWSANGDNLAPKGSKVELTSDGVFTLKDPRGNKIWNANSAGSGVAYAAMLDSGNFVLARKDSLHLWESFDQPTDTILPGQVINQPGKLVSRYMETNYSRGRFQFQLQTDGDLALRANYFPLDSVNTPYWEAYIHGNGFALVFNISGYIFVRASNGSIISMISKNATSTQDFYQRATLEYDGIFRHYIYPKRQGSTRSMTWSTLSFIPENICNLTEELGGGPCGFNSYCTLTGDIKRCHCPLGFSFIDPNDVMKGCKQDFVSPSCDEAHPDTHLFDFYEMYNTNWALNEYEKFDPVTEDWCRQACLDDCLCKVAIFGGGECRKQRLPLSNGRLEPDRKALFKKWKGNSTLNSEEDPNKKKDQSRLIIIGSVLLGSSTFLNLLFLVSGFLVAYRFRHRKSKVCQTSQFMAGMNLRNFTYEELSKATNGFKEEVGRGAFATVYKGVLLDVNVDLIAVKRFNNMVKEIEKEFKAEVTAIGRTHHRNLVKLLGFCDEGEHKLIVYEYMSNGSLANFLFESERPSWYQRVQIALGTARGLLYLHEECNSQILHCDIKPQNVLLDNFYTAKISDFGLAKLLKTDQMVTDTGIRGTKGYAAPEWFRSMPITFKVDVYSYAILLLELICCRKSFDIKAENENQIVLVDWAFDCFKDRKLNLLVEDDKEALDDMNKVEKYLMIAIWCIQEDPSLRPTMKQVLQMLEGAIDVECPPNPYSFASSL